MNTRSSAITVYVPFFRFHPIFGIAVSFVAMRVPLEPFVARYAPKRANDASLVLTRPAAVRHTLPSRPAPPARVVRTPRASAHRHR